MYVARCTWLNKAVHGPGFGGFDLLVPTCTGESRMRPLMMHVEGQADRLTDTNNVYTRSLLRIL